VTSDRPVIALLAHRRQDRRCRSRGTDPVALAQILTDELPTLPT